MDITPSPKQNDRPIAIVVAIIGATAVIVAAIIPLIADWFRSTSNPELPPKVAMEKVPTFTPTSTPTSISTYTLTETISPAPAPALQYTAATSEVTTSETKDVTVKFDGLRVRKEPNTDSTILTSLSCGTKIRGAVETQGLEWLKISSDNVEGYSGVSFNEAYIFEASTADGDYVCPTPIPTFTPIPPTATPTDTPTVTPVDTPTAIPTPKPPSGLNIYEAAPRASWSSGAGDLTFQAEDWGAGKGYVVYRKNQLEDESTHDVLETHPQFVDNGYIRGDFIVPLVEQGQHFMARVGFRKAAWGTDGIMVRIRFNGTTIYEEQIKYTGRLTAIDIDMSGFADRSGTLTLEVHANGNAGKDQFSWIDPRIVFP